MVIMTTGTLKHYFNKVATIFASIIIAKSYGELASLPKMQATANELRKIYRAVSLDKANELGCMYKAGILEGCSKGLEYLKKHFNVEPTI